MSVRFTVTALTAACALGLAACAPAWVPVIGKTPDMQTKSVTAIKTVRVHRIAVMPLLSGPGVPDDAADTVTAELQAQMKLQAGWDLVPSVDVESALQKLPPTTARNLESNAIALGKAVSADGVIYGRVIKYRERVGADYAASSPAAVAFNLHLIAVNQGVVLWSAQFDKEQQSLTDNVFDIYNFVKNQARWLMANEIAQQGVDVAVNSLHGKLNMEEPAVHFQVAPYQSKYSDNLNEN